MAGVASVESIISLRSPKLFGVRLLHNTADAGRVGSKAGGLLRVVSGLGDDVRFHASMPQSRPAEIHPSQTFMGAIYNDEIWPKAAGPPRRRSTGKADCPWCNNLTVRESVSPALEAATANCLLASKRIPART